MDLWVREANRLRADMPNDVRVVLETHEAAGTIDDPAYLAATEAFYDRHVCRVRPYPPEVQATFDQLAEDPTVYRAMNGPNEFFCVGTLRDWSVVGRLDAVSVPTLVLSGHFDEATPATVSPFVEEIPGAQWVLFDESSHMPFVEEPDRYLEVVNEFLSRHD